MRLGAMGNVKGGEFGESPTEAAARHLVKRVARSLGHLRAIVQSRLKGHVVSDPKAREAEVHHDGIHRHAHKLGATAHSTNRRE
eukprot:scaffold271618_cov30-Tisochrysis_lutea.AAC.2